MNTSEKNQTVSFETSVKPLGKTVLDNPSLTGLQWKGTLSIIIDRIPKKDKNGKVIPEKFLNTEEILQEVLKRKTSISVWAQNTILRPNVKSLINEGTEERLITLSQYLSSERAQKDPVTKATNLLHKMTPAQIKAVFEASKQMMEDSSSEETS